MKKRATINRASPSRLIDARIKELNDWRGGMLARVRALIKQADPEAVEEWKWRGVPVWSHDGIICTGESYKNIVKLTSIWLPDMPQTRSKDSEKMQKKTRSDLK